jgi:hypothetical protein
MIFDVARARVEFCQRGLDSESHIENQRVPCFWKRGSQPNCEFRKLGVQRNHIRRIVEHLTGLFDPASS